jgi:hypothetical protein
VPQFEQDEMETEQAHSQLGDQQAQHFANISKELVATIPTKFWA